MILGWFCFAFYNNLFCEVRRSRISLNLKIYVTCAQVIRALIMHKIVTGIYILIWLAKFLQHVSCGQKMCIFFSCKNRWLWFLRSMHRYISLIIVPFAFWMQSSFIPSLNMQHKPTKKYEFFLASHIFKFIHENKKKSFENDTLVLILHKSFADSISQNQNETKLKLAYKFSQMFLSLPLSSSSNNFCFSLFFLQFELCRNLFSHSQKYIVTMRCVEYFCLTSFSDGSFVIENILSSCCCCCFQKTIPYHFTKCTNKSAASYWLSAHSYSFM